MQQANSQDFRIFFQLGNKFCFVFFFSLHIHVCGSAPTAIDSYATLSRNHDAPSIVSASLRETNKNHQYESHSCLLKIVLTYIYYFDTSSIWFVYLLLVYLLTSVAVAFIFLAWFRLLLCFFSTTSNWDNVYCFLYVFPLNRIYNFNPLVIQSYLLILRH